MGSSLTLNKIRCPCNDKVLHDGKEWLCDFSYGGKLRRSKAASYDDCVMQAARFVFNHKPDIRQLTAEEEQLVTWLAQSGKTVQAAEKYIRFAIPRATELGEHRSYRETCVKLTNSDDSSSRYPTL